MKRHPDGMEHTDGRQTVCRVPHEEDARDVLQETSVALYRKLAEYNSDKPFLAWAYGFAYLEVLKHRARNQRTLRHLSQNLLERLALEREQHESILETRLQALEDCLKQLSPEDHELVRQRYYVRLGSDALVRHFDTSRRTLFRTRPRPPIVIRVH